MPEFDHISVQMPEVCPACLAAPNSKYSHHEPEWRFFTCGCAYRKTESSTFVHYHPCKKAYIEAVSLRAKIKGAYQP